MEQPQSYNTKFKEIAALEYLTYIANDLLMAEQSFKYQKQDHFLYPKYLTSLQLLLINLKSLSDTNLKKFTNATNKHFRLFLRALRNHYSHKVPSFPDYQAKYKFEETTNHTWKIKGFTYRKEYIETILDDFERVLAKEYIQNNKNLSPKECVSKAEFDVKSVKEIARSHLLEDFFFLTPLILKNYLTIMKIIYAPKDFCMSPEEKKYEEFFTEFGKVPISERIKTVNHVISEVEIYLEKFPDDIINL